MRANNSEYMLIKLSEVNIGTVIYSTLSAFRYEGFEAQNMGCNVSGMLWSCIYGEQCIFTPIARVRALNMIINEPDTLVLHTGVLQFDDDFLPNGTHV